MLGEAYKSLGNNIIVVLITNLMSCTTEYSYMDDQWTATIINNC